MVIEKIPKDILKEIDIRHRKGESYIKLALEYKITPNRIYYALNEEFREKKKEQSKEYSRKNLKLIRQKRGEGDKYKKYQRDYYHRKKGEEKNG